MNCRISDASVVARKTNQVCCDMGGDWIILNLKSGIYYGIDEVGAMIWALLEKPMTLTDIRDAILKEYDVEADACERDVLAFIEQIDAAGLVEVRNGTDE
jgi:hypothetical protein